MLFQPLKKKFDASSNNKRDAGVLVALEPAAAP
jgi:hypothetical protein